MKVILSIIICAVCLFTFTAKAQENEKLNQEIKNLGKETNPATAVGVMKNIIATYKLDSKKDAAIIEMLKGAVAMTYLKTGDYKTFESYIAQISNKFNQTSYLNMGASDLASGNKDLPVAYDLSQKTLNLYESIKDDPGARPSDFAVEDWQRFMTFARYPYNDTHAEILYLMGKYQEALVYQVKAFDTKPELGFPKSVERYAALLKLNGQTDSAKVLLQNMARLGKLSTGMRAQFKSIYLKDNGNESQFDEYLANLQLRVQKEISKDLAKEMLNIEAPEFTVSDVTGKKVSLSNYKGKIVILDLWATWCAPCIASFPAMQKMVNSNPDIVFLFASVQEQGPDALLAVKKYLKENTYNFHVIMDELVSKGAADYQILSRYKPKGIPSKYIIDKNGKIRFESLGFTSETELINELNAMIAIVKGL